MNLAEQKMVHVLKELKENYASVGVKAEFEAEGTRTEELFRLKEICMAANVTLALKIGGCEALRDMLDARIVGVNYLVAPMVETSFALRKYLCAIDVAFPKDEQKRIEFLINIETRMAADNFDQMLNVPEIKRLNGIVVGRVDFVGSMGLDRRAVNSSTIFDATKTLLTKVKARGLVGVVGGAIAADSLPFLRRLPEGLLDRYETRKICFDCPQALGKKAVKGIAKAGEFELLWLKNKHNHYYAICREDEKRIEMLEERFKAEKS